MEAPYRVRQTSYAVNTVAEWLSKDPAFSFMDTLIKGYPVLAGGNYEDVHKRIFEAAMAYLTHPDSTFTIFLSHDAWYHHHGVTKEGYVNAVKARPYDYNTMLLAAITPGFTLQVANLQPGDSYGTPYTMRMHWYPLGTEDRNYVTIVEQDGEKYAQIMGMYNETRTAVKILKEHRVGKATIIETDGELGYVTF